MSGAGPKPAPPSRVWFSVAVFLLMIPAAVTCFFCYRGFATATLNAPGHYWEEDRPIAGDFMQFAAVAEAWERGRIDEVYESIERQGEFITLAAELPKRYPHVMTFNYPPFICWLLRPLAPLDYRQRYAAWVLMQFSFALAGLWCWRRELGPRAFGVVALAWFVSPPVLNTFILGHAAFMSLGVVSGVLFLLNRRRDFAAGLVLALLLYKPPLGVVLGPLLVLAGRWRAVLGVLVGAGALAAAAAAMSLKACHDYRGITKALVAIAAETEHFYDKHFNLLGFVATFLELKFIELTWMHWALVVVPSVLLVVLAARAWCFPWRPGTPEWCAGASAAVLTTMVVTPYLFSYDTMIVAVAGVYSYKSWDARPEWHRWYVLACIAVAGYFVSGDVTLMEDMRKRFGVGIQLAPFAFAAWAVLDGWWAITNRPTGPTPDAG